MREACGMPPRDLRQTAHKIAAVINVEVEQEEAAAITDNVWSKVQVSLLEHLLQQGRSEITTAMLRRIKLKDGPNVTKDDWIDGLERNNILMAVPSRVAHTKGKTYVPRLEFDSALKTMFARPESVEELPESYCSHRFSDYCNKYSFRRENAEVLAACYKHLGTKKKPGRSGRGAEAAQLRRDEFADKSAKIKAHEAICAQLLEELAQPCSVLSQSPGRKRQRYRQKAPEAEVKQEEEEKAPELDARTCVVRSYHYSSAVAARTRKQVDGHGAQKFPRRSQVHLLPHTIDVDIENSIFTVLHQLVAKLSLKPQMPQDLADVLRKCALEREVVCRSDLNMSQD